MNKTFYFLLIIILIWSACTNNQQAVYKGLSNDLIQAKSEVVLSDTIMYHHVRVDQKRTILPWYSSNPGESYDAVVNKVWGFWNNMELDSNGMKYYMNHQVWRPKHDKRGLGGDQFMMALSSWDLLYNYTGDEAIIDNMKYMADYYLTHSLSSPGSQWPDLPYPYNTVVESGVYDGDMILGKGFLQPDKAGSFGFELMKLYKKTGDENYLSAAVKIANTLASKVQPGDNDNSPWPFKLNAETGETGLLVAQNSWYEGMSKDVKKTNANNKKSSYTTNWTGTLELFAGLIELKEANSDAYQKAFDVTFNWLKTYPAKTNKWGPFFEDVPRWSDTQINATTYAMYLMEHPDLDPNWKETVNSIFQWVHKELDNKEFVQFGVSCINEQTAYRVPGNSHSSRQAAVELKYWEKTGDTTYVRNSVRMLNWATYMVDDDGKNCYPRDDIWMTDGYGDYVRHYLRAMAWAPQLAPDNKNKLLSTSSIVKQITYASDKIEYQTFDSPSVELFRLIQKPAKIQVDNQLLETGNQNEPGWNWQTLEKGGILTINKKGTKVSVVF